MGGDVQHAVFVVLQHVEHITFTTLLCYLTAGRQCFVFGVLQLFLQFVQLDEILLDIVSVGYVDNDKKHDEDNEPYLPAYDLCGEDVTTQNLAQRKAGRSRSLLLDGLLGYHFLERSLRVLAALAELPVCGFCLSAFRGACLGWFFVMLVPFLLHYMIAVT